MELVARKYSKRLAGRLLAVALAALVPAAASAAEIPLTLLSDATGVEDVDAVYDASGRLHVCGLKSDGDVMYWRFNADGEVEHTDIAMKGATAGAQSRRSRTRSSDWPVSGRSSSPGRTTS